MLSRDDLLSSALPSEVVDVPEVGGKVTVRGLKASEVDAYQQTMIERDEAGNVRPKLDLHNVRAGLVARCLVDENGERMFTDDEIHLVGDMSGAVVDRLWNVARRLSGMEENQAAALAEGFATPRPAGASSV
jgi:hypothetical protein